MSYEADGVWQGENGLIVPLYESFMAVIFSEDMVTARLGYLLEHRDIETKENLEIAKRAATTAFGTMTDEAFRHQDNLPFDQKMGELTDIYKKITKKRIEHFQGSFRLRDTNTEALRQQYLLNTFLDAITIEDIGNAKTREIIEGYYRADLDRNLDYIKSLRLRSFSLQKIPEKKTSGYQPSYKRAAIGAIGLFTLVGGYAARSKFKNR